MKKFRDLDTARTSALDGSVAEREKVAVDDGREGGGGGGGGSGDVVVEISAAAQQRQQKEI